MKVRPLCVRGEGLAPALRYRCACKGVGTAIGMSSAHLPGMTASKKIDELYDLIKGIETAMFTTRRATGQLVSRPMATQDRIEGADLWFVTNSDTHKLDELALDPHVNCSYYNNRTHEWVSVAGIAHVSKNRNRVRQLYQESWKPWFEDEGGDKDGGPNDPRIALIMVEAEMATYMKVSKPRPIVLFEVLRGKVTGSSPRLGDVKEISGAELMD
jgi:general stress protein 26